MNRSIVVTTGVLGLAFLLAVPASAVEWKYSSWTPPTAPNNQYGTLPMFEAINKETNGSFTFKNFMGAQLFNNFTTLQGIRDGAVDAGVTVPVYNAAELKAHVTISDMQALTKDGWAAAAAATETVLFGCPECLADYDKLNTMTFGGYAGSPYSLMCKSDIGSMDDLKGKKLGEGAAMGARWAASVGMSRVQMGPADYLQGLQRGTVDCVSGTRDWLFSLSLRDAVKTIVDNQTMGVVPAVSIMTTNKNSWQKLSPEHKKVLVKHMPLAIARTVSGYYANESKGVQAAKERGAKLVAVTGFDTAWKAFVATEPKAVVEAAKARGVQSAEAIVDSFTRNLEKWAAILDKAGRNEEALARELSERVYDRLKL